MTDRLSLHDLTVECRLGVHEWEQATPQTVWIDLELAIDATAAAARDDLEDAVDYGALVTAVKQRVHHTAYRLLETLAEDLAGLVLGQFHVPQVRVRVMKKALPGIAGAAVEIVRPRTA